MRGDSGRGDLDKRFPTTRWTLVLQAGRTDSEEARRAISSLCQLYWRPLYDFARSKGESPEASQDLVQGFFVTLLNRNYFTDLNPEKGRLRHYLKAAFRHFASDERDRAEAKKRGGGADILSLERDFAVGERGYLAEPAEARDPEKIFERRWALTVLGEAMRSIEDEHRASGRLDEYRLLVPFLEGDAGDTTYKDLAAKLGVTHSGVKMKALRLRKRLSEALRALVADTVADESEIEEELRFLSRALGEV